MAIFIDEYLKRLKSSVEFAYKNVPLYREKLTHMIDICSFENMQKLPILNKTDFENKPVPYISGLPLDKLAVSFTTSGTTGHPFFVYLSYEDFKNWLIAKAYDALTNFISINDSDVVVNVLGYGLTQAGYEYDFAAMEAGAQVYPAGPGILTPSRETIQILRDNNATAIFVTPSYALRLAEVASEMDVDLTGLKIKKMLVTGETLTPAARGRIETSWGTEVYDVIGMVELGVFGVECKLHSGLHILSKYLFPEVINPDTFSPAEHGMGELVMTTIGRFGMPFVRYDTRDIVSMKYKACSCGVSGPMIEEHYGRSDGMIKVKGKAVYPAYVEQLLLSMPELGSEYQIVVEHGIYGDNILVRAEAQKGTKADESLREIISKRMREALGVNLKIEIVNYKELPRMNGWKAKRIVEVNVR
ncbi:MAG: AMP-binding protein [archaeon]|nr:AMP-binding protein [archaeon]